MNIALPALIVFVVLLPGFLFRSRLRLVERTSLDYSPFGQVVAGAVLWCCALHALWLTGANFFFCRVFDPALLMALLSSDPAGQRSAASVVAEQWNLIAGYFGSLFAVSSFGPALVRKLVAERRWDRWEHPLSSIFRFSDAPWYYVLTGADFSKADKPDLIAVSAIVNVAGEPMLYYGLLDDFYVDQDGKLDRLVMQQVVRRPLTADKAAGPASERNIKDEPLLIAQPNQLDRFYPIDGDYFVLRYSEAITLNIEYIKLKPTNDVDQAPQSEQSISSSESLDPT